MALIVFLTLLLTLDLLIPEVSSKGQYVQPLVMGMQMAIPYDIANIFNRPIAGVVSTILTIGLAVMILLGVITSPFGYMFGIPSRKYVMGGEPEKPDAFRRSFRDPEPSLDFMESFLRLLPEEEESCQCYLVCYAHGALKLLPTKVVKAYKYFSKDLVHIPATQREAVKIGLLDNSACEERYRDCNKSIFSIIIKTVTSWLPKRFRQKPSRTTL